MEISSAGSIAKYADYLHDGELRHVPHHGQGSRLSE